MIMYFTENEIRQLSMLEKGVSNRKKLENQRRIVLTNRLVDLGLFKGKKVGVEKVQLLKGNSRRARIINNIRKRLFEIKQKEGCFKNIGIRNGTRGKSVKGKYNQFKERGRTISMAVYSKSTRAR